MVYRRFSCRPRAGNELLEIPAFSHSDHLSHRSTAPGKGFSGVTGMGMGCQGQGGIRDPWPQYNPELQLPSAKHKLLVSAGTEQGSVAQIQSHSADPCPRPVVSLFYRLMIYRLLYDFARIKMPLHYMVLNISLNQIFF